jgi:hypothetical protein
MGLDPTDPKPEAITLAQAYESIRKWYTQNLPQLQKRPSGEDHANKSGNLIRALPPASKLNDIEVRAVLGEVIYGNLEWGYHQTDGHYKMAAYALGALEAAKLPYSMGDADKQQLTSSSLWPLLSLSK